MTKGSASSNRSPECATVAAGRGEEAKYAPNLPRVALLLALSVTALLSSGGLTACSRRPPEEVRARYSAGIEIVPPDSAWKGWDYLAEKLKRSGVPEEELKKVFLDPRMPAFTFVPFKLKPRETAAMYQQLLTEARVKIGSDFYHAHKTELAQAHKVLHVSPAVVAAVITVETGCGINTGKELVFNRLARVSSVGMPENLELNYKESKAVDPSVSFSQLKDRAAYLEETFYPEILALFKLGRRENIDILSLKGSTAGAFGLPQFLPSAYLTYAMDGNKDGRISLFDPADAIWSTARYLSAHGWKDNLSTEEKLNVLWSYNRSRAYGETVLKIALRLAGKTKEVKGRR